MGTISRGVKNAFRNSIRTLSIVIILAISISMVLVMLMALKTVGSKIDSVKSSIGNYITVSPAGIRGFEGGGQLLADTDVATISGVSNITKVVKTVSDRVTTGTDTNLQSAIDPGSFGNRQRSRQSTNSQQGTSNSSNQNRSFTMPVMITGTSDLSVTANLNVSKFDLVSGSKFNESSSDPVALVGKDLATKNNLAVDSIFQVYGQNIKVVGIYDGGNTFANAGLVMPIATLQNLSAQTGQISEAVVEVNSINNVASVESNLKTVLGSKADIASGQDSSQQAITPLENIKTISLYSLIGSLAAGAIIIFLTMVMIVRERRREIGVLKAIGASNILIMTQFTVESLILTLISAVVGVFLGTVLSNPILNVLVNNAQQSTLSGNPGNGAARQLARFGAGLGNGARSALTNLHAAVGWEIILYGLLAAVVIAILGSAIPAFIISKVRPAEVLRSE